MQGRGVPRSPSKTRGELPGQLAVFVPPQQTRRAARGNDRRSATARTPERSPPRFLSTSFGRQSIGRSGGREQIARIAVWNCCEDRSARREVLVRLAGHDRRSLALREVVHRQEQQIGSSHQCERLVMRDESEDLSSRATGRQRPDLAATARLQSGLSSRSRQLGVLSSDPLDRFDQEDVRAGQDVDSAHRAAEQPPERELCGAGGGPAPCAGSPCARCERRRRSEQAVRPRSRRVEAVRYREHDLVGQLGKRGSHAPRCFRRAHDDRGSGCRAPAASAAARGAGAAPSGRSSSRRAPRDRRGLRPTACRSPRDSARPPRRRRTAASTRRPDRSPLRARRLDPELVETRRSRTASRDRAAAASGPVRCRQPVLDAGSGPGTRSTTVSGETAE